MTILFFDGAALAAVEVESALAAARQDRKGLMANEYEHDDRDGLDRDDHPLYCRSCGGYLGEFETAKPEDVEYWSGWPYCPEHAAEMRELAKLPDAVEQVKRI